MVKKSDEKLSIVRKLLDKLNKEILYCHWKSNQHFNDALAGRDDLDILINRFQYGQVVCILQELKFKRFYTPSERTYIGIEDYLGFDNEKGNLVHLHLHSQLTIGEKHLKGFSLPIESWLLKNRRWNEHYQVYMTEYFAELLLLILRIGMKVRKRDIVKQNLIIKSIENEFEWLKEYCPDFLIQINNQQWLTERIKKCVKDIYVQGVSWTIAMQLQHYLYLDLAPYSQGSIFYNSIKRNLREVERVVLEIKRRYLKTKYTFTRRRPATGGVTIAFLGSDGAGKSSAINEIYKWLFQFMDVRIFYLGSGDGHSSLLRKPLRLGLKFAQKVRIIKRANNFSDSNLEDIENKKLNKIRKMWIYTLSAERIKKIKCANRCKIRGYIVLTDRYPQSEFNGLCDGRRIENDLGMASTKEEECFRQARLCPPDVAIKMIVSPDIAVKRKPGEIDIETSRNLTERVKQIKFSEKTVCVEIDSTQNQEMVWLDIKRTIWDYIG